MISRHPLIFLSGVAASSFLLLIFLLFQSALPVPGRFEMERLLLQLDLALAHAKLGAQATTLDEAKLHAQHVVNLIEGSTGLHYNNRGKIAESLENSPLGHAEHDEYGIVKYAIDLMIAVEGPQHVKRLNSLAAEGKSRVDHSGLTWLINGVLNELALGRDAAQLILVMKDLEGARKQFAKMELNLRAAIGTDLEENLLPDRGILFIQEVLRDAAGE